MIRGRLNRRSDPVLRRDTNLPGCGDPAHSLASKQGRHQIEVHGKYYLFHKGMKSAILHMKANHAYGQ